MQAAAVDAVPEGSAAAQEPTSPPAGPEVVSLSPDAVQLDDNIRRDPQLSDEFVESIAANGVLAPVIASVDALGQVVVHDGQRRVLAARRVGLARIPVLVAAAPGGPEARMLEQLALNEARTALTTRDLSQAVRQLELFGMEHASVARRIGRTTAQVTALARIAASPQTSRTVAQVPDLTISQAAVLADLEASPVVDAEAMQSIQELIAQEPEQVDHILTRERMDVAEEEALVAVEAELDARSVRHARVDAYQQDWRGGACWSAGTYESAPGVPVTEEEALADEHVVVLLSAQATGLDSPVEVERSVWIEDLEATKWRMAYQWRPERLPEPSAQEKAAAAAERKHVIEQNKRAEAAGVERRAYALKVIRQLPTNSLEWAVQAALLDGWNGSDGEKLDFGEPTKWLRDSHSIPKGLTVRAWLAQSRRNAERLLLAASIARCEARTGRDFWRYGGIDSAQYMRALEAWGYTLAPVELEFCEACEARWAADAAERDAAEEA